MRGHGGDTFEAWVAECRRLLQSGTPPDQVTWNDESAGVAEDLFGDEAPDSPVNAPVPRFSVPRPFRDLARTVYHHRDPHRLHLLYSALWRIVHGEKDIMEKLTDPVMHPLFVMRKQVSRDAHKMKAFVRFRRVLRDGEEWYVAWHRPDHRIVRYTAPFFRERFGPMHWSILTPDESVHWNQQELTFTPGVPRDPIGGDAVEDLWRTYYASVFNPARLKVKAMKTEMPVRHWRTMPEAALIPGLIAASEERTSAMIEASGETATDYIPADPTIATLRSAAQACRGCPLYHGTTHAVCSHGPTNARLVLLGEQPGNEEDLAGVPFVGPAGEVLNRALKEADVPRERLYISEAVKHFKHEIRNGRRYHRTPSSIDVAACRPWLIEEMKLVRPRVLLCLGTTAAHSVIGKQVALKNVRGQIISTPMCSKTLVTNHPAAVLRHPDPAARDAAYQALVADLKTAYALSENDAISG